MYKDKQRMNINQCLGCDTTIIQTVGKRQRLWCSDACRVATKRRSEPITEQTNNEQAKSEQPITNKPERTAQGNIQVSKPGDADYVPQCETTRAFIEGRDKRPEAGKRGKDIKTFEDLPPAAQLAIEQLSDTKEEHKRRTAIAINYQHQFPDRYHSTGIA